MINKNCRGNNDVMEFRRSNVFIVCFKLLAPHVEVS